MKLLFYPDILHYAIVLCCVLAPSSVRGQIVPDTTLPVNSTVTPDGIRFTINDGTTAGGNLFHSFERFDVPTGTEAFFNNTSAIENIFTRVTGGSISNIDGILSANGSANLFLINPNGIIFGPNASLNIGGSFIGSTATTIKFADGNEFSATNPSAPPLLTVNVPIGLQYGQNPGAIQVQGTGHSLILPNIVLPLRGAGSSVTGLRVKPGNTLALVGGDVALVGGILTAPQGRIELGSVDSGMVSLTPTAVGWTLGYEAVQSERDIRLSQQALADASGLGGGDIQLVGKHVTLADGSSVLIQNQGFQPAGSISVNATESLFVVGTSNKFFPSNLSNETVFVGNGGDIGILTQRLIVQDGGGIGTRTFSAATGGNINVNASESVQVNGFAIDDPSNFISNITAATLGSGRGGDVTVSTGRLTVLNGAFMISATLGTGIGGDLTVNATDSVEVSGFFNFSTPSSIGTFAYRSGRGGDVTVSTRQLTVLNGGAVSSSTLNAGDAGSLIINTDRLAVRDGGRVEASTFFSGAAGSLRINAKESVEVSGILPEQLQIPSFLGSSANIPTLAAQQFYRLPPVPSGASGDVIIDTGWLSVTNGGLVNVRNEGTGNAGTARVNANSILLDNQGGITAATASGEGGNIFLQADSVLMRRNSNITATAGGTGNGGNITIDTDTLVALEDSDIIANAEAGFGGRVVINAQGIFGTKFRPQRTPESDITASSNLGASFSGVVQLSTPDVDPSSAVVALPTTVIDKSDQITAGCPAQKGNNFVVTGQGGLPENPTTTLRGATLWSDLRPVVVGGDGAMGRILPYHPTTPPPHQGESPIVEATGWVVDKQGTVTLVAQAPGSSQHQPWQNGIDCGNL